MGFVSSFSPDHLQSYFRIIQEGLAVRQHRDLLKWLQGETQHYLPHQIMLAAWGDFSSGSACYDIVSPLPGVRTADSEPSGLSGLLRELYNRWVELGKMPFASNLQSIGPRRNPHAARQQKFALFFWQSLAGYALVAFCTASATGADLTIACM